MTRYNTVCSDVCQNIEYVYYYRTDIGEHQYGISRYNVRVFVKIYGGTLAITSMFFRIPTSAPDTANAIAPMISNVVTMISMQQTLPFCFLHRKHVCCFGNAQHMVNSFSLRPAQIFQKFRDIILMVVGKNLCDP